MAWDSLYDWEGSDSDLNVESLTGSQADAEDWGLGAALELTLPPNILVSQRDVGEVCLCLSRWHFNILFKSVRAQEARPSGFKSSSRCKALCHGREVPFLRQDCFISRFYYLRRDSAYGPNKSLSGHELAYTAVREGRSAILSLPIFNAVLLEILAPWPRLFASYRGGFAYSPSSLCPVPPSLS